jgi:hypothetical protein
VSGAGTLGTSFIGRGAAVRRSGIEEGPGTGSVRSISKWSMVYYTSDYLTVGSRGAPIHVFPTALQYICIVSLISSICVTIQSHDDTNPIWKALYLIS